MRKSTYIKYLIVLIALAGCMSHPQKNRSDEQLARTYADLTLLYDRYINLRFQLTSEDLKTEREAILKKDGFTQKEFEKRMREIFESPEASRMFFPLVQQKLQQ
jgi:uncharacterized protein YcfL